MGLIKAKQIERSGNGISATTLVTTTPYNILLTDVNLLVDTSVPRTLNLPAPSTRWSGNIWDNTGLALQNNITLHRNAGEKINRATSDLVLTLNGGCYDVITDATDWLVSGFQLAPDYSGEVTTISIITQPLVTIPFPDNQVWRVYLYVEAVDTTGNRAEWISLTTWGRASASALAQLGTDKGPAPVSNISTTIISGPWTIIQASGNNLVASVVTVGSAHCKFTWQLYVQPVPQTLAA